MQRPRTLFAGFGLIIALTATAPPTGVSPPTFVVSPTTSLDTVAATSTSPPNYRLVITSQAAANAQSVAIETKAGTKGTNDVTIGVAEPERNLVAMRRSRPRPIVNDIAAAKQIRPHMTMNVTYMARTTAKKNGPMIGAANTAPSRFGRMNI